MPDGATYVGRPTRWGNPFRTRDERAVRQYRDALVAKLEDDSPEQGELRDALASLRGRDLACWCALVDEHGHRVPCHADVLLELANPGWRRPPVSRPMV